MTTQRRQVTGRHESPRSRDAHHMWNAEQDDKGVPRVRRSKLEPDEFEGVEAPDQRTAANFSQKIAAQKCAAYLGLFGADLIDNSTLIAEIPPGVVRRFNAADRSEPAPRIYTWEELRRAFTDAYVDHAREAVKNGMTVRMASKYLGLPFVIAADIVDKMADVPREEVKKAIDYIKANDSAKNAASAAVAERVAEILAEYVEPGSQRVAVDDKAAAYWEAYYGPFGEELVREIKKRVRADLADSWLRKNGVDQAAADYWKSYFGEYGDKWVSIVPKKLSPSNSKK